MNGIVPWSVRVNIPDKATIEFGGKVFHYRGRARDSERRHIFLADDGISRDFADHDIVRLLETLGPDRKPCLRWISPIELAALEAGKQHDCSSLYQNAPAAEKARADLLLIYVRAWGTAGRPPKTEAGLKPIIKKTAEMMNVKRVSPSSLRRALARWDGTIDSLVSRHCLKGNSLPKANEEARAKHFEFVCKRYFVPERPDVVAVHEAVKIDFGEYNAKLPAGAEQLTPLSLSTTYEMIRAEGQFVADYTRIGSSMAMRQHRAVGRAPATLCANDVWEVDASPLPVIILDDDSTLAIGRATVTLVLDRYSRALPGVDLSWRAESLRSVTDALRMGMTTKEALLSSSGIKGEWPMYGKPGMIVADHARHTRAGGKAFKLICERLGCDPSNTPVKKPYYKGKIERALRTYFFKVCHVLPGSTFSDIFERSKERVPEKVAICTLSQMRVFLYRFIVEMYHPKRHEGIGDSPLRSYKASAAQFGITPAPDSMRLTAILSVPYERTIQAYGLDVMGLHYNGTELMEYGQVIDRPEKVTLVIDPDEITRAWWIDPRDGKEKLIFLPESDRNRLRGWTIEKWERVRAIQRNNPELLAGDVGARKAHALYVRQILEMSGSDGLANRRRAIRALEKLRKRAKAMFNDDFEEAPTEQGDILDGLLDDEDVSSVEPKDEAPEEGGFVSEAVMSAGAEVLASAASEPKRSGRKPRASKDGRTKQGVEAATLASGSQQEGILQAPSEGLKVSNSLDNTLGAIETEPDERFVDSDSLVELAKQLVAKSRKVVR
jgi:transposase InsO family protein